MTLNFTYDNMISQVRFSTNMIIKSKRYNLCKKWHTRIDFKPFYNKSNIVTWFEKCLNAVVSKKKEISRKNRVA